MRHSNVIPKTAPRLSKVIQSPNTDRINASPPLSSGATAQPLQPQVELVERPGQRHLAIDGKPNYQRYELGLDAHWAKLHIPVLGPA